MKATAVITGGSGGLGTAVVAGFRDAGWQVAVPWIEEAEVGRLREAGSWRRCQSRPIIDEPRWPLEGVRGDRHHLQLRRPDHPTTSAAGSPYNFGGRISLAPLRETRDLGTSPPELTSGG